jgi:3-methylcrotonyl-CoA carboxylase alpha subunit
VEFIADGSRGLRADALWFMEMNTRLQVEHPVTEAITGLDLVEWQLRVADGEPLPLAQDQIVMRGCAMEARLYAEDPAHGFLPSPGRLERLRLPAFVRVDSGVEEGGTITPFYDPMIAKLIAHGPDRTSAAGALARAAAAVEVWPVRTNAAFLARCLAEPDFLAGRIDTGFIEARLAALTAPPTAVPSPEAVGALDPPGPGGGAWSPAGVARGFRLGAPARTTASVRVDGVLAELPFAFGAAEVVALEDGDVVAFVGGAAVRLGRGGAAGTDGGAASVDGAIRTPMPGRIVRVTVAVGDAVRSGETRVVLEAMKMEHALAAPADGRVAELAAREGDQVVEGLVVARIDTGAAATPA